MSYSYLTLEQKSSLYGVDDDSDDDDQSQRQKIVELIPQQNDKDTNTTSTTQKDHSRFIYQSQIRQRNLFYKRLHIFSSISVFLVAIFVLCLYVFTNAFDEYKISREEVCLNAEQSFAGYEECKNICSEYRCCFIAGSASCVESHRMTCIQFESCAILDSIASQSSNHSKYLTNVCAEDRLIGSDMKFNNYEDALEECAIACAEVECCFLEGDRSCRYGFEDYCDMYLPCVNMYKVMEAIEKGPGPVILDPDANNSIETLDDDKYNV